MENVRKGLIVVLMMTLGIGLCLSIFGLTVAGEVPTGSNVVYFDENNWGTTAGQFSFVEVEGYQRVIAWTLSKKSREAIFKDYNNQGFEASQYTWVEFDLRVSRDNVKSIQFKLQDHPLYKGMQAAWEIRFNGELKPEPNIWYHVRLPLSYPTWDNWGQYNEQIQRIFFVVDTLSADEVTVNVADVRLVKEEVSALTISL